LFPLFRKTFMLELCFMLFKESFSLYLWINYSMNIFGIWRFNFYLIWNWIFGYSMIPIFEFIVIKFSTIIFCLIMHFEYISCYICCCFYAIYVNVLSHTHWCRFWLASSLKFVNFSSHLRVVEWPNSYTTT